MRPRLGLADARKRVGLKQEELAEQVGVHEQTVSMWERGRQGVLPEHRRPLARALQISLLELDRLINGEPLQPAHALFIADGDPSTRWPLDIDRLVRRSFDLVPPAVLPPLNSADDGRERARRHLRHIAAAVRIPTGPHAGHQTSGVEIIIVCGALAESLATRPE